MARKSTKPAKRLVAIIRGDVPEGEDVVPPIDARRIGAEARHKALQLLCEGYSLSAVGRHLGVSRWIVADWRESPEGQSMLRAARERRDADYQDAAERARRTLREGLDAAAQVLLDALRSSDPNVRVRAASTIMDRTGVPAASVLEAKMGPPMDYSKLTDDEMRELERLNTKAKVG